MTDLRIDLKWWRDAKGFRVVDAKPPEPERPGQSLLGRDYGHPQLIVRRGGRLVPYRPLAEFKDVLFRRFANDATTTDGLLKFIDDFGPLTLSGLDATRGEDVPRLIEHASAMQSWLAACYDNQMAAVPVGSKGLSLGNISAWLTAEPMTGRPRLTLAVDNLLTGLWLQLGQALAGGATVEQCRHCGMLFETGPGTGRRLGAKFCSAAHQIAFNSLRRSKGRTVDA
jgi:hypothetical protein